MSTEKGILLTGSRLLAVLEILYEKDASKSEIIEVLSEKYDVKNLSKETIKLDINTLIKAGFDIKRGNRTNNYKYSLDKSFVKIDFKKEELIFLNLIKNTALELLDYKQIFFLKSFYKRLYSLVQGAEETEAFNFEFFEKVSFEIVEQIEEIIKKRTSFSFIYNSPKRGEFEMVASPTKIFYRGGKVYMECGLENYKTNSILRIDNILKITQIFDKKNEKTAKKERCIAYYIIKNEYLEENPLENFEKIIARQDEGVVIEANDAGSFFIVQRLLVLGKNCLKIMTPKIKKEVEDKLEETFKVYV